MHVKCNDISVQNAFVTLVSDFGNLSQYTSSSGLYVFNFAAPRVTLQTTFALVITASKDGYLVAAIILIIVVIITLLFKFKVIEVVLEKEQKPEFLNLEF